MATTAAGLVAAAAASRTKVAVGQGVAAVVAAGVAAGVAAVVAVAAAVTAVTALAAELAWPVDARRAQHPVGWPPAHGPGRRPHDGPALPVVHGQLLVRV